MLLVYVCNLSSHVIVRPLNILKIKKKKNKNKKNKIKSNNKKIQKSKQ